MGSRTGAGTAAWLQNFIFVHSSACGPFFPSQTPPGWQRTDTFVSKITGQIALVGSLYIAVMDEGGPRIESWAYSSSSHGLDAILSPGVFDIKIGCKTCPYGPILAGEHALRNETFKAGLSVATLMSRYSKEVDWRSQKHWKCNDHAHASRHGTYDGISMHPFETVFISASWHDGEPHTSVYTKWKLGQVMRTGASGPAFSQAHCGEHM